DGNGRTSRFISSYLLTSELEPLMGYRLSYTIKENINKYLKAFKICNDPKNKGDITPFLFMFLDIILLSTEQLVESLQARLEMLNTYSGIIPKLPLGENSKHGDLYYLLVQATLFSELGISTYDLLDILKITRSTLNSRLKQIPDGLLIIKKEKNNKFYSLDLRLVDEKLMAEYTKAPSED
ncbi:MAG: Fic family protein, partial [Ruminococcus sp.]|nr:Fic family protein [Ruminococcus sp.]